VHDDHADSTTAASAHLQKRNVSDVMADILEFIYSSFETVNTAELPSGKKLDEMIGTVDSIVTTMTDLQELLVGRKLAIEQRLPAPDSLPS
jgi:hypothetical protein